ncbi:hypothetical protein [Streptomyces sp. TR02-1]|uniref:hypothetical protein n=1 Tax=Streptomyces sp. TR02-1 TaxID=3385977 RepID=UPI0039A1CCE5
MTTTHPPGTDHWPPVIDTGTVTYRPPTGIPATRMMTAFRTGHRHVTCVVTELGDGMSITNAHAELRVALEEMWPSEHVRIIEHYPPESGCGPEHYDQADASRDGQWRGLRLHTPTLQEEMGPNLPTSSPATSS